MQRQKKALASDGCDGHLLEMLFLILHLLLLFDVSLSFSRLL